MYRKESEKNPTTLLLFLALALYLSMTSLSTLHHTSLSDAQNRPLGSQRRFKHKNATFDVAFPLRRGGINSFAIVNDNVVENEMVATRQVRKRGTRPAYQYEVYPTVAAGVLKSYTILGTYETEAGGTVVLPVVTKTTAQQATDTFVELPDWP